jgi:hypothetical protein
VRRLLLVLAVWTAGVAHAASGQQHVQLVASLEPRGSGDSVSFHLTNLFADPDWSGVLRGGLPVILHWTTQLWRQRALSDEQGPRTEWTDTIRYVAITDRYALTTTTGSVRRFDMRFPTLDSLRQWVEQWFGLKLTPTGPGQWYYVIDLNISTLNAAEINRMQRGGQGSPLGALLDRLLINQGMPSRPLHAQTEAFTVPEQPGG